VVDTLAGPSLRVESVDRSGGSHANGCRFERVRQESSLYEFPVAFAALIHIEVSDQNRLSAVRMPADPLHDHAGALLPSLLSDVIEMRIQEVQGISGVSVLQLCPTANTRIFRIPSHARLIGSFRQPETAGIQQDEAIFFIEYRSVLAGRFAVVAADSDTTVVTRQTVRQVVELGFKNLLHADQVERFVGDLIADDRTSLAPPIASLLIGRVRIPDIIGCYMKLLSIREQRREDKE
jgi:hypothetical protein